jgi:hypothetical protein
MSNTRNTWPFVDHVLMALVAMLVLFAQGVGAQPPSNYAYGDIPLPPDVYDALLRQPSREALERLPAAYDARSDGIVTAAKDQGACGSCWAFASVGALESHLLKQFGIGPDDFAEQQQVSCNINMAGCSGGSADALLFWEEGSYGPIDESSFPYTARDDTPCTYACSERDIHVANFHTVPITTAAFKESLYNVGPSYWRFNVYRDFNTYWSTAAPGSVYVNADPVRLGGHAVLLIGWDDTKGAFLLKNSWGTNSGPNANGTFWLAYAGHANDMGFGMANFEATRDAPVDVALGYCDMAGNAYCDGIAFDIVGEAAAINGERTGCASGALAGPIISNLWPFGTGIGMSVGYASGAADTVAATELIFGDVPLWRHVSFDGTLLNYGLLCAPPEVGSEAEEYAPASTDMPLRVD